MRRSGAMTVQTTTIASLSLVGGLVGTLACSATASTARVEHPTGAERPEFPYETLGAANAPTRAPAAELEDEIEILDDDPKAIAAAIELIESLDDWGAVEDAYAPVLDCFNGRTTVVFDNLVTEASAPMPPDYALGWATVSSIEPLEATADEAILVVRGAAALEGDLGVFLDERIVRVQQLAHGWRITGEANRAAPGCMSERWSSLGDDERFSSCDDVHRDCLLQIDEVAACGGLGCACDECVVQYDACNEQADACLTA